MLFAGVKFGAGDDVTAVALQAIKSAGKEEEKDRIAEKAAKKAAFDSEYDVGATQTRAAPYKDIMYNMLGLSRPLLEVSV